ncbi:MAG: hypothetical protein IPK74_09920 [Deltaproteobacteria bacterium]|nr:hypothetical protein [Deltaproteobacteria bacterium]
MADTPDAERDTVAGENGVTPESQAPAADATVGSLAQGLLHRARRDDDDPAKRWAYRPLVLLVMSLAVGYHALVLLVHNLPGKGLSRDLHTFFNEKLQASNYMRATGNTQSWAMFAPNPHRSNMFMKVLVKDKDGEVWDMAHDMYGRREYPYLFYSRMGKINRRLIEEKGYRRHYAAWVCRDWEMTHDGESPDEIQFVKMWTQVPPPQKVYPYMGYDPMKLHLNQREEESIRCSTSYHGQLPNEIRERLELPPANTGRFRDVSVRTWWDLQQAKQRQAERDERMERARADDDASVPEAVGEVEGAKE